MSRLQVTMPTPDGECDGSLHLPDADGPRPAVILFPDAGGVRETFRAMADRLSGLGYAVLLPDVYYRHGGYEPFAMDTVFTDEGERARRVPRRPVRPARRGAHRRRGGPHHRDLPRGARLRGAGQPDPRPGRRGAALGGAGRPLREVADAVTRGPGTLAAWSGVLGICAWVTDPEGNRIELWQPS